MKFSLRVLLVVLMIVGLVISLRAVILQLWN